MNFKKIITICLLASLEIIRSGYAQAEGTISIWEADNVHNCSIPAVAGPNGAKKYYVINKHGCTNDQAYTVNFTNVDSALTITFYDDKYADYCPDNDGWEIEVLTVKQPTTTDPVTRMSLSAMAGVPDGTLIVPGVLKTRYRADGQIHGKLSCVSVERK